MPFKPKDFNIFQIRYYADGINVRKGIFEGDRVQHHKRAEEYNKFFWEMVNKVTGQPTNYWSLNYFLSSRECANEELYDIHDILIPESEEFYYWYIPKHMVELSKWIQENCNLPIKVMKRGPYGSLLNREKTNWRRKDAKEFAEKHLGDLKGYHNTGKATG